MSMRSRLLNELESTVDPPVQDIGPGGIVVERAPVEQSAADGGISGFPNQPVAMEDDSAWCVAIEAEQSEPVGDIAHLEFLLKNNKTAEGAMLFQTLTRLREALATQVTRSSDAESPVMITAMDAVLLSRLLLKRLG